MCTLAACGGGGADKPAGPAAYQYSLVHQEWNQYPDLPIELNGKPAGTWTKIEVPRDIRLDDPSTKLAAVVETTCGTERVPLASSKQLTPEADLRDKYAREPKPYPISWTIELPMPVPRKALVYLDKKWTGQPATIVVGQTKVVVDKDNGKAVDVWLGTCPSAQTVTIDGAVAGTMPELKPRYAALINTVGKQCYGHAVVRYGTDEETVTYFEQPTKIGEVPAVDYVFREMPEEGEFNKAVSMLLSLPCEIANDLAREQKAKAKAKAGTRKPG